MYIDNQPSIQSTQSIKPAPGHYLVDILHNKVSRSRKKFRNIAITIRWIPSHLNVKGNKEAGRKAKRAVKGDANSSLNRIPVELRNGLPDRKSSIKQAIVKALKEDAIHVLRESPQWWKL